MFVGLAAGRGEEVRNGLERQEEKEPHCSR